MIAPYTKNIIALCFLIICLIASPTSSSNTSAADFSGGDYAEITWNFLRSKGCSKACAAGIMGNLQQESGINPESHQGGGGPGRGICQWEEGGGRFEGLKTMADSKGKDWTDIEVQLEWLWYELSGAETTCAAIMNIDFGGFDNFMRTNDVRWAVVAFEESFERAGMPMYENRYVYAEEYYERFKNK